MSTPESEKPTKPNPTVAQVSRPFFTNKELSYLHSHTIPDQKKIPYSQKKHQVFQFIFQIVKVLKFPLRVLSTSMNYYQRFYLFNKYDEPSDDLGGSDFERDPFVVAITCVFLASKNEDCIKKLKDILAVANKVRDIDGDTSYVERQRKVVMSLEFKLLQVIKFDFINGSNNLPSIDQLVIQFAKKLGIDYKCSMFAWLITFDIMSTPLCLMIPPHCIALAIIIITLNIKPKEVNHQYNKADTEQDDEQLSAILEGIDTYEDFRCPETLVNEGIIYLLDFYIHQMNFSILNDYLPPVDKESGKEQVFKFMDLKSRFNDLKTLNERCAGEKALLEQDEYLNKWDFSVGSRGSVRFMLGNKRRRFDKELTILFHQKQAELGKGPRRQGPKQPQKAAPRPSAPVGP